MGHKPTLYGIFTMDLPALLCKRCMAILAHIELDSSLRLNDNARAEGKVLLTCKCGLRYTYYQGKPKRDLTALVISDKSQKQL